MLATFEKEASNLTASTKLIPIRIRDIQLQNSDSSSHINPNFSVLNNLGIK